MALLDTTTGVNQLLNQLGIGSIWNLAQGSFSIPGGDTITFLDVSSFAGLNLDTSLVPTAEEIINAIKRSRLSGADGSGSTFLTQDTFSAANNILGYQLPDSNELLLQWGSKRTSVTIVMMLCNSGYIAKIQKAEQIFSTALGINGGTLQHPIFGTLLNAFVDGERKYISGSSLFNGTLCIVRFSSSNTFNINTVVPVPFQEQCLNLINQINNALTAIGNLPNVQVVLSSIANNPLFTDPVNVALSGTLLTDHYFSNIGFHHSFYPEGYDQGLLYVGEQISDINPQLATASIQLNENGLPTDFDIGYETNLIMELLCQIGDVVVGNFGNGGLSSTTTEVVIYTAAQASSIVYSESYYNHYGQLVQIERQIQSVVGADYNVLVTTTTTTFVSRSDSFVYIKSLINNVIVASNVYSVIYPDNYITYASLISGLENLYALILGNEGDTWRVPFDMTLYNASKLTKTSTDQLLKRNANLIGHRPLSQDMVLYL